MLHIELPGNCVEFYNMENALTILHVTEKAHVLERSSTIRYRKLCCADRKPLEDFKRTIIARTT